MILTQLKLWAVIIQIQNRDWVLVGYILLTVQCSDPWVSEDLHSGPLVSKEHCSAPLVSIEHCSGPLACPQLNGALIKWANIALQKSNSTSTTRQV